MRRTTATSTCSTQGSAPEAIEHLKRGRESLAAFEAGVAEAPETQAWQKIYREDFVPLVGEGRREIFRVVD